MNDHPIIPSHQLVKQSAQEICGKVDQETKPPRNCWLDDDGEECPSPCVLDTNEPVTDCIYANALYSKGKRKTDCRYYIHDHLRCQPPTASEVAELVTVLEIGAKKLSFESEYYLATKLRRAAELLERLAPPQPIPLSERLPGPGDCFILKTESLEMLYCWLARSLLHSGIERLQWELKPLPLTDELKWPWKYWLPASTQTLPAYALPIPTPITEKTHD